MAAGQSGPIPKRDSERVRRNIPDVPTETVTMIGTVDIPDLGIPFPHDITMDFWTALTQSGQAKYYEPSDWQYARMALFFADGLFKRAQEGRDPSSMMLQQVNSMLSDLLVAEGQRRRVRLEVERATNEAKVFNASDMFRARFDRSASAEAS